MFRTSIAVREASRKRYYNNKAACIASTTAWQKANPEKVKATTAKRALPRRLKKYGITLATYKAFLLAQLNRCAICHERKREGKEWHIDHCHETKKVRGVLCGGCNKALGLIKDNADTARHMAEYLEENLEN